MTTPPTSGSGRRWLLPPPGEEGQSRETHVALARALARVLRYLQIRYGFDLLVAYARTYHNFTPDFGPRADPAEVRAALGDQGIPEVGPAGAWEDIAH